jgi:virginiamycin B lyase
MSYRSGLVLIAATLAAGASLAKAQTALPAGPGKELVEKACMACHSTDRIANAGYGLADWRTDIERMIASGAPLQKDQVETVAKYLAGAFPEKATPVAVLVPGPVEVTFKEWVVPTPRSHPHDPLPGPDGSLWYTGQLTSLLGRLDLETGKFTEYRTKVENSGPHGLAADRDGNIWFTANLKGYIGKLDPKTGAFTEYKLPDPEARDPHTPLIDAKGTIWFTVQGGNMVGRLDPKSGEIKLVRSPTPHSSPYGLAFDSKGVPFYDEFDTNKLASVDPTTMAIREYALPNPGARPRRIAITGDDMVWYSDWARGYLGRLDPRTGTVTEWPSPSGLRSQPYGMTAIKGAIWYCESGTQPNTLVRFDPATEKFQSWAIPSGGGVVRNMAATADGNIVMAESGVNRVALVTIK